MATVTRETLTCDLCGEVEDVTTWTFGLDGKAYEIDLCRKDGEALDRVAARYIAKARKTKGNARRRPAARQRSGSPHGRRGKAETSRPQRQAAASGGAADGRRPKGIYVYGILPGDIEMAEDTPGVGEHPGPLRNVRLDGLAALISEVDTSGRLGSPGDLQTYREILDATAAEVPVVPLRFGTILTSEDAVAEELLAARHDEFTAALERLEGRAEFQVEGRYVNEAVTGWRERDTRALRQALDGVCAASAARPPADEPDGFQVAFLVDAGAERDLKRAIRALARKWDGRVELRLLGPMAAYDFTGTAQPES